MKSYTHFSIKEREIIERLLKNNKSIRYIASLLLRSPSSISREIKRNTLKSKKYNHIQAQSRYNTVRTIKCRKRPMYYNTELFELLRKSIVVDRLSPE